MTADLALKSQVEQLHQQVAASDQEFCIDLEGIAPDGTPVWQWMGYSTKGSASRSLGKLIEGVDYLLNKTVRQVPHQGGWRTVTVECVLFSRDGFKQWGMLAGTEQGRKVRLYFIECEKRLQLEMLQPTALNNALHTILERQQALAENLAGHMTQGFHQINNRVDTLEQRVARIEEQQCDQLYVFVRMSDLTIKLGYTQELDKRRKAHEAKGFQLVGAVPGTHKRETEIKRTLRAKGFKPKYGDEYFAFSPEIVSAFAQEGLPIGNLCCAKPKNALPRRLTPACETLSLPLF
jgi:phage anti-repressor protein